MRSTVAAIALVLAVTTGSGAVSAPASADVHPEWGKTSAPNAVLKTGCKNYMYNYELHPPEGDWVLETFVEGPRGKRLASDAFAAGSDPEAGPATFRICKATTRYGKFTIKAQLSVQNGVNEYVEGWLPPSHFRLHRPRH